MSYRKEKKYKLTYSDLCELKSELSNSGMEILYNPRIINSCYFDNNYHDMFHDSEEGVLPRKKIRIRWYGDDAIFNKEIKISSIEGRYKISKKLESIKSINDIKNIRFVDDYYGNIEPKLIISYQRSYYSLNKMRITFDKNITYSYINSIGQRNLMDKECVMEIKVPYNCPDDYIEKYIYHSTSRFSKYSRALLYLTKDL